MTTWSAWLLGLLLGMRHAFEPDHLAAVSTLATEQRGPRGGFVLGALWGAGHTTALLVVGAVLALVRGHLPGRLADVFELGVALMLITLGVRALMRAWRAPGRVVPRSFRAIKPAPHRPDLRLHPRPAVAAHRHGHAHVHLEAGALAFGTRSLVVGVIHGLAGSGALIALVMAELPTTSERLAYVALFGIGSTMAMALLSGVLGLPLARLARQPVAARAVGAVAGVVSLVFGVYWGWPLWPRLFG